MANTLLATTDLLPAVDTAATTVLKIGEYDRTIGVYFNPFVSDSIDNTGASVYAFGTTANSVFTEITRDFGVTDQNNYYPGALNGSWNIFAAAASPFDIADTSLATSDTLFLSGVQAALCAAEDIYTNWESEMSSYNSDAEEYNDDVATYNDWLADEERDEDDEPEIPERPCPPGDIEAIEGTVVYYNDADAFDETDYEDQAFAA